MPKWKNTEPLFRGASARGVSVPAPTASCSIAEHILYLGGAGRATPYHSTTEDEEVASHFAGTDGRVYRTTVRAAESRYVRHIGQLELLRLLRGKGQGSARWSSAYEVMQARRYVEQWSEHLLDFRAIADSSVKDVVDGLYTP